MENKLKIGIDIDGVIADYVKKFLEFYNKKTRSNFTSKDWVTYNFWDFIPMTKEEGKVLMDEFYSLEDFDEIPLIEGSKEAIDRLAKQNQIYIITARPLRWNEKTNNFFKRHFPGKQIELIHSRDKEDNTIYKREICESHGIRILVEDHGSIALQCAERGVLVFLLNLPYNKGVSHEKIVRVNNWNEIVEKINEMNIEKTN